MSSLFRRIVAVVFACALATPAGAELIPRKDLSLAMALTVATTAVETCKGMNQRVSVAVVGRNGEVLVHLRGDNASPHTMENSFRKAYTARTFRVPSGEIVKRYKDNPQLGAIHLTNVIAAQGALPIMVGTDVIGAAGVSGAVTTPESPGGVKDEACVKAGIDKIAALLK
jgi:uncharacterized protein GlcG (DUF336 family)